MSGRLLIQWLSGVGSLAARLCAVTRRAFVCSRTELRAQREREERMCGGKRIITWRADKTRDQLTHLTLE